MTHAFNPEDPSPGDKIILIDEDGHATSQYSRVRRLVSEGFDGVTFEVIDSWSQTRYVRLATSSNPPTWREVFI